jgi:hypothetical protein
MLIEIDIVKISRFNYIIITKDINYYDAIYCIIKGSPILNNYWA